jgi:uncharacterized membrane protein
MNRALVFVGIGIELLGLFALSIFLGRLINEQYSLGASIYLGLFILSLIVWFTHIALLLQKLSAAEKAIETEIKEHKEGPVA